MDIEINFDKLMKKHKVKNIPKNIWNLIRELMDIYEEDIKKQSIKKQIMGRSRTYGWLKSPSFRQTGIV